MTIEATMTTRRSGAAPVAVLALRGDMDTESTPELEESLEALLQLHERIVVDLTWTPYVCSAGWRVLLLHGSRGAQPGIKVAGMHSSVRDVFDLLGLAQVMDAYDTVDESVAAFGLTAGTSV